MAYKNYFDNLSRNKVFRKCGFSHMLLKISEQINIGKNTDKEWISHQKEQ